MKKIILREAFTILIFSVAIFFIGLIILNLPILFTVPNYITGGQSSSVHDQKKIISTEPTLIIPQIDITAPIIFGVSRKNEDILEDLEKGVSHVAGTALPGEKGNSFITGHSSYYPWKGGEYKQIFALLDKIEKGDVVYVDYDEKRFGYKVSEKKIVSPSDISVMGQGENSILTLMTCYPPGTTINRLIVIGELIYE